MPTIRSSDCIEKHSAHCICISVIKEMYLATLGSDKDLVPVYFRRFCAIHHLQVGPKQLLMEVFFLVISLVTARNEHIPLLQLGRPTIGAVAFAIAMLGICLSVMRLLWRRSSEDEKRRVLLTRPNEPKDLGWWFLVSLAAGTVEEITYRGVMFALLLQLTRNWWIAVAICVLFFALGHANQRLSRMAFVGVIAVGCHVLVWITGALYLAMAVHFIYDFIAGIIYLRWAQQMRPSLQPRLASA